MKDASQQIARSATIALVSLMITGACSIIIIRLAHLQIHAAPHLSLRSKNNYLRSEQIPPPRGNILDCSGQLLATNRPVISIVWEGGGSKKLTAEQLATVELLTSTFSLAEPIDTVALTRIERQRRKLVLLEDISFDQLSKALELFPDHPAIKLETSFKRYYPHDSSACHVLGYIGDLSCRQSGVMGLEKCYDMTLRGEHGKLDTIINSLGYPLSREAVLEALPGSDIHTTIDLALQQAAEEAFPANYTGTMIVMDAATGALRTVLSRPTFNPNIFVKRIDEDTWHELLAQSPFINRAFAACYPPASLFKLVTLIAALDTQLIDAHETWYCPGYTLFCGRRYHCNDRVAHGFVTIPSALAQSCNTPFFDIGRRIKINTLAHYAHTLGLGTIHNTLLHEKRGIVPTTQWKLATYKEPWWPGETLSVAIGQGFLQTTPIQLCVMVNTICQGYMITPHLSPVQEAAPRPVPIKPEVLHTVKDLMRQVVTVAHGTGHQLKQLHDMHIYAKTGTAQTCALKDTKSTELADQPHGWFTAHVSYKHHPPITLIVFAEHAGSSKVAASITKHFLRRYRTIMDQRASSVSSKNNVTKK